MQCCRRRRAWRAPGPAPRGTPRACRRYGLRSKRPALRTGVEPIVSTVKRLAPLSTGYRRVPTHALSAFRQGVEDVCEELRQEPGIDAVTLGRQVQERRTVSQARLSHGSASVAALLLLSIMDAELDVLRSQCFVAFDKISGTLEHALRKCAGRALCLHENSGG